MTEAELDLLNIEVTTDPKYLGLVDMDNPTAAGKLNEIGASNEEVSSGIVNGQELQMAVEITEYAALTSVERDGWLAIISAGNGLVDIDDQRVIDQAIAIWSGTTTLTNL